MSKSKASDAPQSYAHPRYTTEPPKEWLKGRMKHPTGWCSQYQPLSAQGHEGDKPFTVGGQPRKVCSFSDTCPCYCHYQIDQMFEMAGIPRPPAEQSSEYLEMTATLHLQTQAMLDSLPTYSRITPALSNAGDLVDPPTLKRTVTGQQDSANGTPAPPIMPVFAPTPTGRRARGQLEYDVLQVCVEFANNVYDWEICTPKAVSEAIGKAHAIEPPSTGAINAVWDRWERLEFAEQDSKPSRFVRFKVDNPSPLVLDAIKARSKRTKKMAQAEQRRGILRPTKRVKRA